MVTVSFLPPDLRSLDRLSAQLLVLCVFEDERPLRGLSGLLDWRTCGMLSRFLKRGFVTGAEGEIVLFPPGGRIQVSRGLLFGLGSTQGFDERAYRSVCGSIVLKAERLGARSLALTLPGLHKKRVDPGQAMALFAEIAGTRFSHLTIIATAAERREMQEALKHRRDEFEVAPVVAAHGPGGSG